jgi:hypothetical protein
VKAGTVAELTPADLVALRDEILKRDLLIRRFSGVYLQDSGGNIPGEIYSDTAELTVGMIVSVPLLQTSQMPGPAIHVRAEILANDKPGDPPLLVSGHQTLYPIVPDPSVGGWRPAIKGIDN